MDSGHAVPRSWTHIEEILLCELDTQPRTDVAFLSVATNLLPLSQSAKPPIQYVRVHDTAQFVEVCRSEVRVSSVAAMDVFVDTMNIQC